MGQIDAIKRNVAVVVVAVFIGSIPLPAQASGLLEAILGVFGAPPPAASPIQQVPPDIASPPLRIVIPRRSSNAISGVSGYCVRLCDGRYFPLPHLKASSAMPKKLCDALCPSSHTLVYWGNRIDQARASNGSRYSDLITAFDYRKQIVPNCTCNGNDIFGTAAVSIYADITLRPGDVVVTENGAKVFIGSIESRKGASDFTSVNNYSRISANQNRKISEIQVGRRNPLETPPMNFNARIVLGAPPLSSWLVPPANDTYGK